MALSYWDTQLSRHAYAFKQPSQFVSIVRTHPFIPFSNARQRIEHAAVSGMAAITAKAPANSGPVDWREKIPSDHMSDEPLPKN